MRPNIDKGIWIIVWVLMALTLLLVWCDKAGADEDELTNDITAYIEECGYKDDGFVAAVMEVAYGEYEQDPWLWTMIARYESHWKHTVRGAAGERGWIQIHPCHKTKRFTNKGLDWDDPVDQLRVGCTMLQERLDEGKSLWSAYSPWTTRTKAWRTYKTVLQCEPGDHCPSDEDSETEDCIVIQNS